MKQNQEPERYAQLIFDKWAKNTKWRKKTVSLINCAGIIGYSHPKEWNLHRILHQSQKLIQKCKTWIHETPKTKHGNKAPWHVFVILFCIWYLKCELQKSNNKQMELRQTNQFLHSIRNDEGSEKTSCRMEQIFPNHYPEYLKKS